MIEKASYDRVWLVYESRFRTIVSKLVRDLPFLVRFKFTEERVATIREEDANRN